jgi:hypothetical protein
MAPVPLAPPVSVQVWATPPDDAARPSLPVSVAPDVPPGQHPVDVWDVAPEATDSPPLLLELDGGTPVPEPPPDPEPAVDPLAAVLSAQQVVDELGPVVSPALDATLALSVVPAELDELALLPELELAVVSGQQPPGVVPPLVPPPPAPTDWALFDAVLAELPASPVDAALPPVAPVAPLVPVHALVEATAGAAEVGGAVVTPPDAWGTVSPVWATVSAPPPPHAARTRKAAAMATRARERRNMAPSLPTARGPQPAGASGSRAARSSRSIPSRRRTSWRTVGSSPSARSASTSVAKPITEE